MRFYEPSIFHDKISILDQFEALKQYIMGFDPGAIKPGTAGEIKELEFDITNFTESRALGDIYATYANDETSVIPFKFPFMISGSDTIVIDVNEEGTKLEAHLDADIIKKLEKVLICPEQKPAETVLVAVEPDGTQTFIKLGAGLIIKNGILSISDEKKTTLHLYRFDGTIIDTYVVTGETATITWGENEVGLSDSTILLNGEVIYSGDDMLLGFAIEPNTTSVAYNAGQPIVLPGNSTYTFFVVTENDYPEIQFAIDKGGILEPWRIPEGSYWSDFAYGFSNGKYDINIDGFLTTADGTLVYDSERGKLEAGDPVRPGTYYVGKAPAEQITFTVNSREFTVDAGTTWGQWVTDTGGDFGYRVLTGLNTIIGPIFRETVVEDGVSVNANEMIDFGNYHEISYIASKVKDIKINNNTYQYIDGMTWAQWITSGFNSRPFYILDGMISLDKEYDEEGQALVLKYWENYAVAGAVLPSDKMDNTRQTVRKWVYQSGAPSTKETFYIDDIAYKKLPGVLSWTEWVNSSDNTGGFRVIPDYLLVAKTWSTEDDNGLVVCDEITETPVTSDGYFSGGSYITKMYY